jgi:alcohol oxidase
LANKRWPMWIDSETGFRQDVPHRLIYPTLDAGNTKLSILTESKVVRVLFDESKRAVGIEYMPAVGGDPIVVKARKLVVVSAGTLGSPLILQRSGIGNQQKLSPLGIPIVSTVDGVGAKYQDHNLLFFPYRSKSKPEDTLDELISGRLPLEEALKYKESSPSKYILGWNAIDIGARIRPSTEEVKAMGPVFEDLWNRDYRDHPARPMSMIATICGFVGDPSSVPLGQYFCLAAFTLHPYSQGSIHITGPSVSDPPNFNCGYLSDPADISTLVWTYKKQRELVRRMKLYDGIIEEAHPKFREGSKAAYAYADGNETPDKWENIEYDKEDDEAIVQFIRQALIPALHSLGTCSMKPLADGGVVDKRLNVYGVKGLKVAGEFFFSSPFFISFSPLY